MGAVAIRATMHRLTRGYMHIRGDVRRVVGRGAGFPANRRGTCLPCFVSSSFPSSFPSSFSSKGMDGAEGGRVRRGAMQAASAHDGDDSHDGDCRSGRGTLYVVGTPIGNLGDISMRALETLRKADKILCEDTRRTKALLNHFEIQGTRLESYHMHNEFKRTSSIIQELRRGQQIALVSDAGMPGINDPGSMVIREAVEYEAEIDVVPIPGPSAFLAALVGSGLLEGSFQYCGFMAPKTSGRQKQFAALRHQPHVLVFYASPHALVESLKDAVEVFGGDRRCCLGRELTKMHEEFQRGTLSDVLQAFGDGGRNPRGEYSVVIEGWKDDAREEVTEEVIRRCLELEMAEGVSRSVAAKSVSQSLGVSRKLCYEISISMK